MALTGQVIKDGFIWEIPEMSSRQYDRQAYLIFLLFS